MHFCAVEIAVQSDDNLCVPCPDNPKAMSEGEFTINPNNSGFGAKLQNVFQIASIETI